MDRIIEFIKLPFKYKLAKRLNRTQHLKAQLLAFIPMIIFIISVIGITSTGINLNDGSYKEILYYSIDILVALTWIIVSLTASISRLHDCNYSGWWILLINLLSSMFVFPIFVLSAWPGSKGNNSYGRPSDNIWIFR